jgi:hypothetical protein
MPKAIKVAAEKWIYFCESLRFREDVPLHDRITAFYVPFSDGARSNVAALRYAPDAVLLLIVAKGIERSGTHSRPEIERALGLTLPD